MSADPLVSVLVVNYNGRRHLDACLRALAAQTLPRERREVVLVENGSSDGSAAHVRAAHPAVRVVPLSRNRGFAGGNNAGLPHCRGRYVVLLNNDTIADPRCLEELVAAAEAGPRAGGVAAKLVFASDPGRLNSAGLELYSDGGAGDRGFGRPAGDFDEPAEVFGGCGAALLLRRELLDDVGGFDERLFLYYEDVDLAWRARLRGWNFVYAPRAVVRHVYCGSTGERSPAFVFYNERNRCLVGLKNGTARWAIRAWLTFHARLLRLGLRVLRGRESWGLLAACLHAALSLYACLPAVLRQRFAARRGAGGAAVSRFVVSRPD